MLIQVLYRDAFMKKKYHPFILDVIHPVKVKKSTMKKIDSSCQYSFEKNSHVVIAYRDDFENIV